MAQSASRAAGARRSRVSPRPSWPELLRPQAKTWEVAVTHSVWKRPHTTWVTICSCSICMRGARGAEVSRVHASSSAQACCCATAAPRRARCRGSQRASSKGSSTATRPFPTQPPTHLDAARLDPVNLRLLAVPALAVLVGAPGDDVLGRDGDGVLRAARDGPARVARHSAAATVGWA